MLHVFDDDSEIRIYVQWRVAKACDIAAATPPAAAVFRHLNRALSRAIPGIAAFVTVAPGCVVVVKADMDVLNA